jgi:rRNA maturation endonuclease Nob1
MRGFWNADEEELPDGAYRCIRCGEGYDRQHAECPACGGAFLAPVSDEETEA